MTLRLVILATLLPASACTLVTNFDEAATVERTSALCSDNIDNDEDGLTDCQDYKCLDQEACCNLPAVVLQEEFDPPGCRDLSCDDPQLHALCTADRALSATLWQSWGTPFPTVCEGELNLTKTNQCYPVGILSRPTVDLAAGLEISGVLSGAPDRGGGYAEIGLTFSDEMQGSVQPCTLVPPAFLVAGLRSELGGEPGTYAISAHFAGRRIGVSDSIAQGSPAVIRMEVGEDRRMHYVVNDRVFATSEQSVDGLGTAPMHVILRGLGTSLRFESVTAVTGTQCDLPDAWQEVPDEELVPDVDDGGFVWDEYSVQYPMPLPGEGTTTYLYYTGCQGGLGECFVSGSGIGLAVSPLEGEPFARISEDPLVTNNNVGISNADGPLEADLTLVSRGDSVGLMSYVDVGRNNPNLYLATPDMEGGLFQSLGPLVTAMTPGEDGAWDDREVCCTSTVRRGTETMVWYAGRSNTDDTWKIGLARSIGGGPLVKDVRNPVLVPGELGSYDDRSATRPEVIFDERRRMFRMWYQAESVRDFLSGGSIAYAVSLDGVKWVKYDGNPVLTPEGTGLESLGAPAIFERFGRYRLFFHARRPEDRIGGFRIFSVTQARGTRADEDDPAEEPAE